jgi:hypothetical protein
MAPSSASTERECAQCAFWVRWLIWATRRSRA